MDHLCLHLCLCSFFTAAESRAGAKQSARVLSKERKVCIYWYSILGSLQSIILKSWDFWPSISASFGKFYFLNISITVVLMYSLQSNATWPGDYLHPWWHGRLSCRVHVFAVAADSVKMFPVMPQILCVILKNVLRLHIFAQKSIRASASPGCFVVKNKQHISCFQGCLH